jgi:hypothetical protein
MSAPETCPILGCGHTLPCPWHPGPFPPRARGPQLPPPPPRVDPLDQCADGQTYEHELDHRRLAAQRGRVMDAMKPDSWFSLAELSDATGDPEASISARLRDFRKERFGGHTVDRRRRSTGTWEYRLTLNQVPAVL